MAQLALAGPVPRHASSVPRRRAAGLSVQQARAFSGARCPKPLLLRKTLKVRPSLKASAADGDDLDAPPLSLSPEEAASFLGIKVDASFDDIVAAKNTKLSQPGEDESKINAAYDALLMLSMKKRLSGSVDTSVRFADVPKYTPPKPKTPMTLPGGLTVSKVSEDKLLVQSGTFAAFAAWTLIQGFTDSPAMAQSDVAGLQLGLSLAASVYFLRENKRLEIGKSLGITGAGLVAGVLIGALVQGFLRVDIVPIAGFESPGVLVSEFGILGIWAASTFLA